MSPSWPSLRFARVAGGDPVVSAIHQPGIVRPNHARSVGTGPARDPGYDHGGVGELLRELFPRRSGAAHDEPALLATTQSLLAASPEPKPVQAPFTLEAMCRALRRLPRVIVSSASLSHVARSHRHRQRRVGQINSSSTRRRALALRTGRVLYLDSTRGYTRTITVAATAWNRFPITAEPMPEGWRIARR